MADYATVSEVKALLQDLQGDTNYDDLLSDLAGRASREIEDLLSGRFFYTSSAVTRLFDGTGTRQLVVPDLISASQLRIKVGGTAGSFTVITSDQYFLQPANRRVGWPAQWLELSDMSTLAWHFDRGYRTVEVTGDWGWAAVPSGIKDVCLEMVVHAWRNRGAGESDESGPPIDGPSMGRTLSRRAWEILEAYGYRSMRFA